MNAPPAVSRSSRDGEGAGFGRIERASSGAPLSEINMTPLIDVMLVLLVIFIVTAPLMVSAVKVELPRAAGTAALTDPGFVSITVDSGGQVFMDDQPLGLPALAAQLQARAQLRPDTEVRLRADASVPYGRIVEIMGTAHTAGLHRIGFVADVRLAPAGLQRPDGKPSP